jgi:hypothetical protein
MNLTEYPKYYFDFYFKGKHPKKFNFTESVTEFLGVLVFLGILQGILMAIYDELNFMALIEPIIYSLIAVGVLAGAVRLVFNFNKGKSTFKKIAALFYKYLSGFVFITGIYGVVTTLIILTIELDLTLQAGIGGITLALFLYLIVSIFPSIAGEISKLEKVKQPRSDMIFAFGIALLIIVLFVITITVLGSALPEMVGAAAIQGI